MEGGDVVVVWEAIVEMSGTQRMGTLTDEQSNWSYIVVKILVVMEVFGVLDPVFWFVDGEVFWCYFSLEELHPIFLSLLQIYPQIKFLSGAV